MPVKVVFFNLILG